MFRDFRWAERPRRRWRPQEAIGIRPGSVPRGSDGGHDFVGTGKVALAAAGDDAVADLDLEDPTLGGHESRLQRQMLPQRSSGVLGALS